MRHTDQSLPTSPSAAASVGLRSRTDDSGSASQAPIPIGLPSSSLIRSISSRPVQGTSKQTYLELKDGAVYEGYSFGAEKSIAGELVFQTGMVGYPESITDPSYRGQILVITFPLVGNYGVPSRETKDELLQGLPKYFEASEIHIAGLVVASYSGEDFSHHLAVSSLGTWLKEQGVPAMYGVDTRALTRRIREEGSMLGRMLHQKRSERIINTNGVLPTALSSPRKESWRIEIEEIDWYDPNVRNLVRDGQFYQIIKVYMQLLKHLQFRYKNLISSRLQKRNYSNILPVVQSGLFALMLV